MKNHNTYSKF